MRRRFLALLIVAILPSQGPVAAPPADTAEGSLRALDELLDLMGQRLDVMHDVARHKWAARAPIEDPVRERILLDDVAGRGKALGLEPTTTQAFFRAQIEAAKLVQRADFRRWEADPSAVPREAPDLAGVLRPRIDTLNRRLLAALVRFRDSSRLARLDADAIRRRAEKRLGGGGIDGEVRAKAIKPLLPTAP